MNVTIDTGVIAICFVYRLYISECVWHWLLIKKWIEMNVYNCTQYVYLNIQHDISVAAVNQSAQCRRRAIDSKWVRWSCVAIASRQRLSLLLTWVTSVQDHRVSSTGQQVPRILANSPCRRQTLIEVKPHIVRPSAWSSSSLEANTNPDIWPFELRTGEHSHRSWLFSAFRFTSRRETDGLARPVPVVPYPYCGLWNNQR